jgi:hypothetical protein
MGPALAAGIAGVVGGLGSFFGGKSKAAQENDARRSEYELLKYQIDRQQYESDKKRALYAGLMRGLLSAYGSNPRVAAMGGMLDIDSFADVNDRPAMPAFRPVRGPSLLGSLAGGIGQAWASGAASGGFGGGVKKLPTPGSRGLSHGLGPG